RPSEEESSSRRTECLDEPSPDAYERALVVTSPSLRMLPLAFLVLFWGCGPAVRVALVGTPEVDSVLGKLELEKAEGDLFLLTAVLRELPSPENVHPEATRYLAWITDASGEPEILGEVERDRIKR